LPTRRSNRLPKNDPCREFSSRDHAPERDQQFSSQRHDHRGPTDARGTTSPVTEPLRKSAIFLEHEKTPGKLDQAATHASVASFGEPLLPSPGAAFVWRSSQPGITSHRSSVTQLPGKNLPHEHIRCLDADADNARQKAHHGVRAGLRSLLQAFQTGLFDCLNLLAHHGEPCEIAAEFHREYWEEGARPRAFAIHQAVARLSAVPA